MYIDKQKLLKKIDKDLELSYVNNVSPFSGLLFLFCALIVFLLGTGIMIDLARTSQGIGVNLFVLFLSTAFFYVIYLIGGSWKNHIKLNKKYGKAESDSERIEQIVLVLKKKCDIEEIKEYYPVASDLFRKKILDKIFFDAIAEKYELKESFNYFELLEKLSNEKKIEIENN